MLKFFHCVVHLNKKNGFIIKSVILILDSRFIFILQVLKPANTLLTRLARLLKLTTAQDVAFSLVLRRNSSKPEIATLAKQHLKKRFLDFVQCYLDAGIRNEGILFSK